jgi:hypothetical protein
MVRSDHRRVLEWKGQNKEGNLGQQRGEEGISDASEVDRDSRSRRVKSKSGAEYDLASERV